MSSLVSVKEMMFIKTLWVFSKFLSCIRRKAFKRGCGVLVMRGQVTIAGILALILVLVVVGFSLNPALRGARSGDPVLVVQEYVQSCLVQSLESALVVAGAQGGFTYPPITGLSFGGYVVPVLQKEGYPLDLTKGAVAQLQLAPYTLSAVEECVNKGSFPGLTLEKGKPSLGIALYNASVSADLEYPLIVRDSASETRLDMFRATVPIRLGLLLDKQTQVLDDLALYRRTFDAVQLSEFPFDVDIVTTKTHYIFQFTDSEYPLNNQPYRLVFASELP